MVHDFCLKRQTRSVESTYASFFMGEHTFLIESDFFTVKWAGFPIFCSLFSSPTSEQSSKQFKSSAGQRIMEGMSPPGLPSGSPSPPRSPPIQPSSSLPQMWSQPRLPPRSAVTLVGGKGGGGGRRRKSANLFKGRSVSATDGLFLEGIERRNSDQCHLRLRPSRSG